MSRSVNTKGHSAIRVRVRSGVRGSSVWVWLVFRESVHCSGGLRCFAATGDALRTVN